MPRRPTEFQTIRSEGGLLPPDLLRRVIDPAGKVSGVEPTAYGLPAGERLNEAITQSWNRLRRHWAEFRGASKDRPEGDATTGLTNDKWSLPLLRELGFGFLTTTAGPAIDGKTYAISRFAGNTAIHLVGCGVSLDRRAAGVRGAAQSNRMGSFRNFSIAAPAISGPSSPTASASASCATTRPSRGSLSSNSISKPCSTAKFIPISCCSGSSLTLRDLPRERRRMASREWRVEPSRAGSKLEARRPPNKVSPRLPTCVAVWRRRWKFSGRAS